ncbi:ABC transporter related protein [Trypanosoma grayi]|uniref:ABC transporter related protein n=1 Tax=Trypanosoma grayi TaxID=71804 RepID=UPI0004F49D40|nr:ABC transporter related protein [Trypanosoma grayi]KEG12768.1 ABC transporter related protein [Trypanosoma grayi]
MSLILQCIYMASVSPVLKKEHTSQHYRANVSESSWSQRLYAPTFITKIDDVYLLVDSWHHRVIYNTNLDAPVGKWRSLLADGPIWIPHSVANNGEVMLVESSDHGSSGSNHSLIVYRIVRKVPGKVERFTFVQRLQLCAGKSVFRPHRIQYDSNTDAFYVYITGPPTLGKYRWSTKDQKLYHVYCEDLSFMEGAYARSFTIINDVFVFIAGPRSSLTFARLEGVNGTPRYTGRAKLGWLGIKSRSMNDVVYMDNYWYISSTYPCSLLRVKSLKRGPVEMLHKRLNLCRARAQGPGVLAGGRCNLLGTPYYSSFVDGKMMIPFLFHCSGVLSYDPVNGSSTVLWGSGWTEAPEDVKRRGTEW